MSGQGEKGVAPNSSARARRPSATKRMSDQYEADRQEKSEELKRKRYRKSSASPSKIQPPNRRATSLLIGRKGKTDEKRVPATVLIPIVDAARSWRTRKTYQCGFRSWLCNESRLGTKGSPVGPVLDKEQGRSEMLIQIFGYITTAMISLFLHQLQQYHTVAKTSIYISIHCLVISSFPTSEPSGSRCVGLSAGVRLDNTGGNNVLVWD